MVEYKKGDCMKKTSSWETRIGVIMLSGKVYQNDATTNKFSDGREKTVEVVILVEHTRSRMRKDLIDRNGMSEIFAGAVVCCELHE